MIGSETAEEVCVVRLQKKERKMYSKRAEEKRVCNKRAEEKRVCNERAKERKM